MNRFKLTLLAGLVACAGMQTTEINAAATPAKLPDMKSLLSETWMSEVAGDNWHRIRKAGSKKPKEHLAELDHFFSAKYNYKTFPSDAAAKLRLDKVIRNLVGQYKIHLMPTDENYADTVTKVITALNTDPELQKAVYFAKFSMKPKPSEELQQLPLEDILPRIVIYSEIGKEHAQTILNKMRELFGTEEGLDISPRFNQKVTRLIYFAQGNGDDKAKWLHKKNPDDTPFINTIFEAPDYIYYRSDFTGTPEDYHLTW